MSKRFGLLPVLVLVSALLVLVGTNAWAGTTGKLNGVVRDADGQVLPGANVVVKDMSLGATADQDGYYVVINIPPGTYTVTGSLIGYETVSTTGVRVVADQTSTIDFTLKETALELGELVVTAGRPLVEPDKTSTKYTMDLQDTERQLAAARSTAELLQLQPGVAVDGSGRLRGSRNSVDGGSNYANEVAYVVDGVRMNSNDGRGRGPLQASISRGNIQELSVITGVTPAEYGNAQGGVVQIVTKDGGSSYNGWVEFRYEPAGKKHWGTNVYDSPELLNNVKWDDPDWRNEKYPDLSALIGDPIFADLAGELIHKRTDYTDQYGYGVEASIAGPIGDKVSFVVTAKHDQYASRYPDAERTGFTDDQGNFWNDPGNINLSGSITFRATPNLKFKLGGLGQFWDWWSTGVPDPMGKSRETTTLPGVVRGTGSNLFLPANWSAAGQQSFSEELEYMVMTHTISPKTFYEVRLSRSRSQMDTAGGGFHEVTGTNYLDEASYFNIGRQVARWGLYDRQRYSMKVDLSSQATKGNFVKTGLEMIYGSLSMEQRWDSSAASRGLLTIDNKGVLGDPVHPFFLNFYAQDKMEFQGMIVNVGVRMDAFNPNHRQITFGATRGSEMYRWFTTARDFGYESANPYSTDSPWHVTFSPRIGVAHPITERSQMRFSTGVFLQYADLWYYYGEDWWTEAAASDFDINGNGVIDASEKYNSFKTTYSGQNGLDLLRPMQTTAFEVGADYNFVSDYTATLTAYYKDEVDQMTQYPNETWLGPVATQINYSRTLDNGAHGATRGVELSVRKAFSHNFSFNVSYNYQWAQTMTGKNGNIRRNIYFDSLVVAQMAHTVLFVDPELGVPVYGVFIDWAADPSGARIPVQMSEDDIARLGAVDQSRVTNAPVFQAVSGPGIYESMRIIDGPLGDYGVKIQTSSYHTNFLSSKSGDRRHFGSVSMLMSLPDDFQFGNPFLGSLLKNVRVNVTSRIQTGTIFSYTPPEGGNAKDRQYPMDSRTDLAVEKTFNVAGRVQPTLFMDMRNIFNQQDRNSPTSAADYTYLGLEGPTPLDNNYATYGDTRDRSYANSPRQAQFGLRVNW